MKVIVKHRLKHDGKEYAPATEPQEVKDLTKAEATVLVGAGVIEIPAKDPPKNPPAPTKTDGEQTDAQNGEAAVDGKPAEGGQ